jgi:hypothetical protein
MTESLGLRTTFAEPCMQEQVSGLQEIISVNQRLRLAPDGLVDQSAVDSAFEVHFALLVS